MTETWKHWQGQVIGDGFPLQRYLGGDESHAVFLTDYRGREPCLAAIKIVIGDPQALEEQLRCWHAAAKLSHRHLIQIFAAGRSQLDDTPLAYLVMEHADENLGQVIPGRVLTVEEARQMLDPVLSALSYLHAQGFAHGHLKPGDIMAVGDCVKITSAELCRDGECFPATADPYCPPENITSPAGDVWSLGMILVEALTQYRPAREAGARDAVVQPTLPQPFLEIARRALRAEPQSRATPQELAALMQPAKHRTVRRRDAVAVLIGLAVAAVVITPRFLDRQVLKNESVQAPVAPPVQPRPLLRETSPPPAPPTRDEIVERVLPQVPAQASRSIQGRVRVSVRIRVDRSGRVADARLESAGPSRYFAQLALQAARRWKFAPAAGSLREREWILHFEFSRAGTRITPARISR